MRPHRIAARATGPLVAVLLNLVISPQIEAQASSGVIDGVVTDTALAPLGDATVSILGSTLRVVTGPNGRFRISDVAHGQRILLVRRIGFEAATASVQVADGETQRLGISLQRTATKLDTVKVTGQQLGWRMTEFEQRRKLGEGQFMTEAEIDKRGVAGLDDLIATFTGVIMIPDSWPMNRRINGVRPCPYQVFIDGVRLPTEAHIDNVAIPKEIAGIEVYSGPSQIPLPYKSTSGGGFCGVILLWTRSAT